MKRAKNPILRQFQENIAFRYLTISSSFVLVVQLVLGLFQIQRSQTRHVNELHEQIGHQAEFIRQVAPEAVLSLDFLYLETLIQQVTENVDIVYGVILDQNGKPLTRHLNYDNRLILSAAETVDTQPGDILSLVAEVNRQPYIHKVQVPIEAAGGSLLLGYSTQRVRAESVSAARNTMATALLVSSLLSVLTIVLFNRQVNLPLKSLKQFAQDFEAGDLEQRIEVQYLDEIGQVSSALNQMANQLQGTMSGLAIARDEAIAAAQSRTSFLATMSHELRTPLNAILGMTEALQEQVFGETDTRQHKAFETIERSGLHLLSLINDILDVSKIGAGQLELDCTPVKSLTLCKSSLAFVKQQAFKKRIQLETQLPNQLPALLVDERRIRQVLINLLNNAVKFTPEGGQVTLAATVIQPLSEDTPALRISITDTGIGIAPDDLEKLFQPFVQIDSDLNREYEGTGLGLVLVKQIVELHGGQVSVTSTLGKGSCFTVELPCAEVPVAIDIDTVPHEGSPHGASAHGSKHLSNGHLGNGHLGNGQPSASPQTPDASPLILLAEDHEDNISTISGYLMAKGYRLILAKNGQEAVELAQSAQPDLILMDIQMPGMDGFSAMQHIRKHPAGANIPIIALTALAMEGDSNRCLSAGANAYMSKPVKMKQLNDRIQQLVTTAVTHLEVV